MPLNPIYPLFFAFNPYPKIVLPKKINFSKAFLQQQEVLCIKFPFDLKTKDDVRAFGGVCWSVALKCYYLPFTKKRTNRCYLYLKKLGYLVDYSSLKTASAKTPTNGSGTKKERKRAQLSKSDQKRLERYSKFLRGQRLSENTVRIYSDHIKLFLGNLGGLAIKDLGKEHLVGYLERIIEEKQYSISTHRQLIGALNHFCSLFLNVDFNHWSIKRPTKNKSLPAVLSQDEIIALIPCTYNLKHRAIITLLYSSGLRVGESLRLKLADIDLDRMQLRIRLGKGRKDRYVGIARGFLPLLRNYLETYRPKTYFIEGPQGNQYSASSIRKFLFRSCKRAKILKKVTPHTLRHSYATHLIENGVGLRYVQELLGHAKPETTMIYTHVARKDLLQIKSPLDVAISKLTVDGHKTQNIHISGNPTY